VLRNRLAQLEGELSEARDELVTLDPGEPLPGLYLLVDTAGRRALVPSELVQEIVRLVAFTPLPSAHAAVLGSFMCRGEPVVALDLATFFGATRDSTRDAHIIVLRGSRSCGLVVDAVRALLESPTILERRADTGAAAGDEVTAGFCRVGDDVLPLISIEALEGVAGKCG
jgi:purine-binding chemotaxis protein CheW